MRFRLLRSRIMVLATVLLFASACGGREQERRDDAADSSRHSMLPALPGAVLVDSIRIDLTGDGIDELVVTSRVADSVDDPLLLDRFDRIDIYSQGVSGYRRLFVDAVEYGLQLTFDDVTGDSIADIVVRLDAGGNNPIEGQGMQIYGLDAHDALALLFLSPDGAPMLRDLNGDGMKEVLLSDQFWGMMSHSEVIGYTSEVYTLADGMYVFANERFSAWYDGMLRERRREYERARRAAATRDGRVLLYRRAAEYLVWNLARGGVEQLNRVWNTERVFLSQRLGEEQFSDLEAFVDEVTTEQYEQSTQRLT